jgi:hypothetical protein
VGTGYLTHKSQNPRVFLRINSWVLIKDSDSCQFLVGASFISLNTFLSFKEYSAFHMLYAHSSIIQNLPVIFYISHASHSLTTSPEFFSINFLHFNMLHILFIILTFWDVPLFHWYGFISIPFRFHFLHFPATKLSHFRYPFYFLLWQSSVTDFHSENSSKN